jgi:hypothetical protein
MAQVGSSDRVNFVVEMGRPSKKRHTSADGDWSGVYRFFLKKGSQPRPAEAVVDVAKIGESTDMGKAETLASFIDWSMREYPARRYMLVVWNHGQGWRLTLAADRTISIAPKKLDTAAALLARTQGDNLPLGGFRAVSQDDDTKSILYNREIQDILDARFKNGGLDVLGFDACLMAMMETAYAFEPSTKFLVASEELEPGAGWRYSKWMGDLVGKPEMDGAELAGAVIKSYKDGYGDEYLTTLSSIGLAGVRESAQDLSAFSDAVRKAGKPELSHLVAARASLLSYGSSNVPRLETSVDLLGLLRRYELRTKDDQLRAWSQALRERLAKHVLANYASLRSADPKKSGDPYGSEGIAIYFPESKKAFQRDGFHQGYLKTNTDRPVDFVREQTWAELIYAALGVQ